MTDERYAATLSGVPETMLWTLYNRATHARRSGALLHDPDAIRLLESIDYDYARSFGAADLSHAVRSRVFDDVVKPWLAAHPGGTVIELGCGLETQFQRCDDGQVHWIGVDLPEAIALRERFLPERERCRYVRKSVLDTSWLREVDALIARSAAHHALEAHEAQEAQEVFITAQGLLMYLAKAEVRMLIRTIAGHFGAACLLFDVIPRWYSRKTLRGLRKTPHYQVPPMPWSLDWKEIGRLRDWSASIGSVEDIRWNGFSGFGWSLLRAAMGVPAVRNRLPGVVRVHTRHRPAPASADVEEKTKKAKQRTA
ncbi:class I SAM-dependent methyltransferase [Paraburkholderia hayleyella]|uniref:class I SAM-dependent methyltransferase n=1 Tax=Paraburkholderia hayleyella TaxID=2152889 RepID=UPI0012921F87|nr:class I SAM-dependent methyltransferase [Paraburkholderia hayleyella]